MVVLPPYLIDPECWDKIPEDDRWIFNKMEICKRFGHGPYGPCGVSPPIGTYCIRPIMDLHGMALGGFWKCELKTNNIIPKEINKPGYFWSPWEDGPRGIFEYIENRVVSAQRIISFDERTGIEHAIEIPPNKAPALPEQLRGISRYMRLEYLGDVLIDIGPRHQFEEGLHSVVKDYKNFDPSYVPRIEGVLGEYQPYMKRIKDTDTGAWRWEEIKTIIPRKIYN